MRIDNRFGAVLRRLPGCAVRLDLPLGPDEAGRFLPFVLALLVYVAGLGGIGLMTVDQSQRAWGRSLAATMTLEIPADASPARLKTVLALLRQTRGIAAVHLVGPAETARLLAAWLGPSAKLDDLPVPRLIDLRVAPDATIDLATLHRHLASVVPEARLDDHGGWLNGMGRAARRLKIVLAAGLAAALLAIAPAAMFATRAALAADRPLIELVHLLGAADGDIARPFALRALRLALLASAIGGGGVLLTILALGGAGGLLQLPAPVTAVGIADWRAWAIVAAVALAAALVATVSGWASALGRLARMP